MPDSDDKLFYTPFEVSERYNHTITTRTLANWRSAGISPPFTKIGGRILYPAHELYEWERRRTVDSTGRYKRG